MDPNQAAFLDRNPVTFPIVTDPAMRAHGMVSSSIQDAVAPFPRHLVVGGDGRVRLATGRYRFPDLLRALESGAVR